MARQTLAFVVALLTVVAAAQSRAAMLYVSQMDKANVVSGNESGSLNRTFTPTGSVPGPQGVAVDAAGNVYAAQPTPGEISKITPSGGVTPFVTGLPNVFDLTFGPGGNLYATARDRIYQITPSGDATTFVAGLNLVTGLTYDGRGNFFATSPTSIYKVTAGGAVSVYATAAEPYDVAVDAAGNVYASTYPDAVLRFAPDGSVSTFASGFNDPEGLAFDPAGNLYVVSTAVPVINGGTVSKVTPDGTVSTVATGLGQPTFIAVGVPEPASAGLFAAGAAGLLLRRRPARPGR